MRSQETLVGAVCRSGSTTGHTCGTVEATDQNASLEETGRTLVTS